MNTLQLEKFEGVAKFLKILFKVIWIIAIVVAVLSFVGAFISLLIPTSFIDGLLSPGVIAGNITVYGLTFDVNDFNVEPSSLKVLIMLGCIIGVVAASLTAFIFVLLERILKEVVNKAPFSIKSITSIKLLSVAIVAYGIASSICQSVLNTMVIKVIPQISNISNMSIDFDINLSVIFAGLLIFLLAKIFEYGNALQTEVDEML